MANPTSGSPKLPRTPLNVASSGALISADLRDGVAIGTGRALPSGGLRTSRVTIRNPSGAPAELRLFESEAVNRFASGELELFIDEIRPGSSRGVFRGTVGGLPVDGVALGSFAAAEERTYRLAILRAPDTGAGTRAATAGAKYRWRYETLGVGSGADRR